MTPADQGIDVAAPSAHMEVEYPVGRVDHQPGELVVVFSYTGLRRNPDGSLSPANGASGAKSDLIALHRPSGTTTGWWSSGMTPGSIWTTSADLLPRASRKPSLRAGAGPRTGRAPLKKTPGMSTCFPAAIGR